MNRMYCAVVAFLVCIVLIKILCFALQKTEQLEKKFMKITKMDFKIYQRKKSASKASLKLFSKETSSKSRILMAFLNFTLTKFNNCGICSLLTYQLIRSKVEQIAFLLILHYVYENSILQKPNSNKAQQIG